MVSIEITIWISVGIGPFTAIILQFMSTLDVRLIFVCPIYPKGFISLGRRNTDYTCSFVNSLNIVLHSEPRPMSGFKQKHHGCKFATGLTKGLTTYFEWLGIGSVLT